MPTASELAMKRLVASDLYAEFIRESCQSQMPVNILHLPMVQSGVREYAAAGHRRVLAALEESRPRGLARLWEGLVDWLNG